MAKTQKKLGKDKKKFSLGEFIWLGFNYTVGISFIGACASLSNIQKGGIGMNILWIYILEGLFAGICAWAFAKMARAYKSSNNGGAYIYARGTFNKFVGLFITFMLYVGMPFMITFQILMLIRGTFSPSFIWKQDGNIPWYGFQWGVFGDLYLDLIGIGIYMISAVIIFFGIKWYKKMAHISLIMKWVPAIFLIVTAAVSACASGAANLNGWFDYSTSAEGVHFNKIITSFNSCFYFFAGFEIFSTAGHNVEKPEKNIGLGVTLIMIISTIFYVLVLFIFFAAINPNEGFQQNETMAFWSQFSNNAFLLYAGPILIIISSISLKVNAAMQNSLYSGTMLQPMAVEGYFPDSWAKLDKDGLPTKASKINLFIVATFVIIWLALPDLIRAINCQGTYNDLLASEGKEAAEQWLAVQPVAFDVSSLTAASATITITIYITVLLCTLKMGLEKKLTIKTWEWIAFSITLVFMIFLFFYHYYEVISNISTGISTNDSALIVGSVVELTFVVAAIVFFIIWYFTYYSRKYHTRLASNPKLQKTLDAEFLPIDDWSFTAKEVKAILVKKPVGGVDKAALKIRQYLVRNEHINGNVNNQNYREASRILILLTRQTLPITITLGKIGDRFENITDPKHLSHREVSMNELLKDYIKDPTPW